MKLTKKEKIITAISILWEWICLIVVLSSSGCFFYISRKYTLFGYTDEYLIEGKSVAFLVFSLPVLLYWLGVWIFGFGYITKSALYLVLLFKKPKS